MEEFGDVKGSKFNAGFLQTQRVHELLNIINHCKIKLDAFNADYQDWNYFVYLNSINSLFDEIEGWMDENESKECTGMSNELERTMEDNKIHDVITIASKKGALGINKSILFAFKKGLRTYERKVRRLGIKYKVIAVTADDDMDGL